MSLNQILQSFNDEAKIIKVEKKYIEKDKDERSLKGILQKKRLKLIRETAPIRRGVSFAPHAITYSFCRRMKIAQLAGLVEIYYDRPTPRVQTGFDIGTSLHNLVQTYFWEVGMLKGTYECLKCDKKYDNVISPSTCPSGKKTHTKKHLRFREVTASNKEYSLYGRSDGILVIENSDEPLEIKSLPTKPYKNSNNFGFYFEDLDEKGPRENHLVQLMLYMFMFGSAVGHLFYICKNDGRIKTYEIQYDQSIIDPYLNEILFLKEQAALLKEGKKILLPSCCGDSNCTCHNVISPIN